MEKMEFYILLSNKMIEKRGMPETIHSGKFEWKLNFDTIFMNMIFDSAGDALNWIKSYKDEFNLNEKLAICNCEIDDKNCRRIIEALYAGNSYSDCPILVTEMTWITP